MILLHDYALFLPHTSLYISHVISASTIDYCSLVLFLHFKQMICSEYPEHGRIRCQSGCADRSHGRWFPKATF